MESGFAKFGEILEKIDGYVWGVPLIVLIILTGIYLTVRVRGLQVRHLGKALKYMVKTKKAEKERYQALERCVQLFLQQSVQVI